MVMAVMKKIDEEAAGGFIYSQSCLPGFDCWNEFLLYGTVYMQNNFHC